MRNWIKGGILGLVVAGVFLFIINFSICSGEIYINPDGSGMGLEKIIPGHCLILNVLILFFGILTGIFIGGFVKESHFSLSKFDETISSWLKGGLVGLIVGGLILSGVNYFMCATAGIVTKSCLFLNPSLLIICIFIGALIAGLIRGYKTNKKSFREMTKSWLNGGLVGLLVGGIILAIVNFSTCANGEGVTSSCMLLNPSILIFSILLGSLIAGLIRSFKPRKSSFKTTFKIWFGGGLIGLIAGGLLLSLINFSVCGGDTGILPGSCVYLNPLILILSVSIGALIAGLKGGQK